MEPAATLRSLDIKGLSADSRKVAPGYLFAALPGTKTDGRRFIDEALRRGAVAVLTTPDTMIERPAERTPVALVTDANPRRQLACLAARYYGAQPEVIAAVTGTNGKTSVAEFTRQIWLQMGHQSASLGTLGLNPPREDAPASLTTPDPVDLHRCLAALAGDGISHLAMEASSHGLDQFRLDGLKIAAAAFTNLSRDHLDYHGSESAYLAAKERLFAELLPQDATAVLNADIPQFETLSSICRKRGLSVISYGAAGRDLRLVKRAAAAEGQSLTLDALGRRKDVSLPLAGAFQAANALAALGLVLATAPSREAVLDEALAALGKLKGVAGRLQLIGPTPSGGLVFVDYAHTPDALENLLSALRAHTEGELVTVFGCGGDRDAGKRPIMGEIAERLADRVFVTDDNPRGEPPQAIRRAIMEAAPGATEIGDRAEAILAAISSLARGDVVVIAGKGHEPGQIVGDKVLPFDDREVAREVLTRLPGGRS